MNPPCLHRYFGDLAVEGIGASHAVDQAIEPEPGDRVEEQGEEESYGDKDTL